MQSMDRIKAKLKSTSQPTVVVQTTTLLKLVEALDSTRRQLMDLELKRLFEERGEKK